MLPTACSEDFMTAAGAAEVDQFLLRSTFVTVGEQAASSSVSPAAGAGNLMIVLSVLKRLRQTYRSCQGVVVGRPSGFGRGASQEDEGKTHAVHRYCARFEAC